jgi:hypothetical protein
MARRCLRANRDIFKEPLNYCILVLSKKFTTKSQSHEEKLKYSIS